MSDRSQLTTPRWYRELICGHVGEIVLEIGCGEGSLIEEIVSRSGSKGVACDLSNRTHRDRRARAAFVQCDGRYLPFPDDTFDTVVSIEVIEHVDRPVELAREVYRVLEGGGAFFLKTPNRWTHDAFQLANGNLRNSREWHPSVMTHGELSTLLSDYFEVTFLKSPRLSPNQREKLQGSPWSVIVDRIPFGSLPLGFQPSIFTKCMALDDPARTSH